MTTAMTTNKPTIPPCKCRLTMPNGNTRATFRAKDREHAERLALRLLKKKALPKGWKLTVDGPASLPKDEPIKVSLTNTAPAYLFKVGDRVRRTKDNATLIPAGTEGKVITVGVNADGGPATGRVCVQWDGGLSGLTAYGDPERSPNPADNWNALELVKPASIESRAFKVGDRVEWIFTGPTRFTQKLEIGDHGAVVRLDGNGWPIVDWDGPDAIKSHFFSGGNPHKYLRLITPAPKSEDKGEAYAATLHRDFREAFKRPGASWPELLAMARNAMAARDLHRRLLGLGEEGGSIKDAIQRLQADLKYLGDNLTAITQERDNLDSSRDAWAAEAAANERRAKVAEGKLADVAALHRTMALAKASPVEEWDFTTLMGDVLARD